MNKYETAVAITTNADADEHDLKPDGWQTVRYERTYRATHPMPTPDPAPARVDLTRDPNQT